MSRSSPYSSNSSSPSSSPAEVAPPEDMDRHQTYEHRLGSLEVMVDYTTPPGGKKSSGRTLSMVQMLLLNSIVCGLEFCASAAFCYIPPMLLKAGLPEENMSVVLGVGPLLGFFFVPIIGRASDQCRSRYGRRRPFIFALSLMLICSLILIPYGEAFGEAAVGRGARSKHIGVVLLVVGAVLLDFTSQACLTPCEALLSDASRHTDQYDRCFTVYSFMVSLGGCIGYLITALDWSSSSVGVYFGSQERSAFSMLIILFAFSMIATLGVAQETPVAVDVTPEPTPADGAQIQKRLDQIQKKESDPGYESGGGYSLTDDVADVGLGVPSTETVGGGVGGLFAERSCHVPGTPWQFASCESLMLVARRRLYQLMPDIVKSLFCVPAVLRPLALANFFSWTAIMGFNLFYSDFIGQAVYGGDPNADEDSPLRERYDLGVRMGSWGLLSHCVTSAVYATFVEKMVCSYGSRVTYMIGMMTFTFAMMLMVFIRNIYAITALAACTGIAYATVTTIPFMLITLYHEHKEIFFYDTRSTDPNAKPRGVGMDMATLDSAYFLSQVLLSAIMGYVVHLTGTVLAYIVCAGGMGAIACACITRIITNKMQMQMYIKSRRTHAAGGAAGVS